MKSILPRVRIDSGNLNEWVTLDLSTILGADVGSVVGIGVTIINGAASKQGWGLRPPGSTDEYEFPQINAGYATDADIGIAANGTVEIWRSSADIQIWLTTLYYADEAEFYVNALDVTPPTANTWTDTDITGSTGGKIPLVVFGLYENKALAIPAGGWRPDGWTTNDPTEAWPARSLAGWKTTCAENGVFETLAGDPELGKIHVTGYLFAGAHVVASPPAAGTFLSQANEYELVDCSALPEQYRIALIRIGAGLPAHDGGANAMAARSPGDTDDLVGLAPVRHMFVALDDLQRLEAKVGHATNERVHLLGGATWTDFEWPEFEGGVADLVTVEHDLVEAEVTQSVGGAPPRFTQWQRSDDDGQTWDDVPDQDGLAYRVTPTPEESYLLRARQFDSGDPVTEEITNVLSITVPATPTVDVDYMLSSVDGSNIRIKALLQGEEESVRLVYSTDPHLTNPSFTTPKAVDSDDFLIFDEVIPIASLDPDTRHYYAVEIDGVLCGKRGRFRTPPAGAASFRFCLGYCADTIDLQTLTQDMVGTEHIRRQTNSLMWLFPGDFHYLGYSGTNQATRRANYRNQLMAPRFGRAMRSSLINYVYDDHCGYETGVWANKEDSLPSRASVVAVSKQVFPWETASPNGTYRAFTLGRVRFIALDERTFRSYEADTDDENKIHLGAEQEAWYKAELLAANADPDIAIIAVIHCVPYIGTDQWNPPTSPGDNWGIYQTERQRIADWEQANGIKGHLHGGKMIRIYGDMHGIGFDDGTNDNFATSGTGTGAPSYVCGALSRNSHVKGNPWSHGASAGMFGTSSITKLAVFEVDDDGGDTVKLRVSYREFAIGETDPDNYVEPFGTELIPGTTPVPELEFAATPVSDAAVILPTTIPSSAQVFTPTLVSGSPDPVAVQPATIPSSSQVFAPQVLEAVVVAPAPIATDAQVFEPTLQSGAPEPVSVQPGTIPSSSQVFTPSIVEGVAGDVIVPAHVPSSAAVHMPTVVPGSVVLLPATVVSTSQVFKPSLVGGVEEQIPVTHTAGFRFARTILPTRRFH